jgi:hypothetical protein
MNHAELPISNPCTADWTTMTLADGGRFCGDCKKVVRELAQMTETEARRLLASPPTEGLCVRYVHDATGEIVFRRDVVPTARLARLRHAAVAAMALSLPALAGCAAQQTHACMGAAPAPEMMGVVTMGEPPAAPPAPSASATTPVAPPSAPPVAPPVTPKTAR